MATSNKSQGTIHSGQVGYTAPNPQLQALIDKANDKRSVWTKTKDFFSGAWDSNKRIAEASKNDLGNTAIGVAKGVGNLPSDVWNLLVLGSKYTGPIPAAVQADVLNYSALQAYQGGDTTTANAFAVRASEMMSSGYASDIFEIKGDAQKGGAILSMAVPVGALAKGAGTAAKAVRTTKTADAAADAAKGADAAKAGDGVAILSKRIKLKTTPLKDRYKGENIPNNKDNWLEGNSTVKYLTDAEKEAAKLTITDGKLFDSKGNLFDTSNATTWDGKKSAIFVMDEQGNIFASKYQEVGLFHHSSLGQGLPVSMAGEIKVVNGVIVDISNQSGHYMPTPSFMNSAMNALRDQGVDLANANIRVLGP